MSNSQLPAGFEALETFVDGWALAGAANRARRRIESSYSERDAFYAAAKDLLTPALTLLDAKPLGQLDDSEKRLMNLMLSFAHVALAVEIQGDDEAKHSQQRKFMIITRACSDFEISTTQQGDQL